jgi:hypothetical protein
MHSSKRSVMHYGEPNHYTITPNEIMTHIVHLHNSSRVLVQGNISHDSYFPCGKLFTFDIYSDSLCPGPDELLH